MVKQEEIILEGKWIRGRAVSIHTLSSELEGYDECGHPIFKTIRSEMGEYLYQLKYQGDHTVIAKIVDLINFNFTHLMLDAIIPIPPSNIQRNCQPVIQIARNLGKKLELPVYEDFLFKSQETSQLKDISDFEERLQILESVFDVKDQSLAGKNVLLFDDLYRSGATLNAATQILYEKGNICSVYVLTLTKTRSNR